MYTLVRNEMIHTTYARGYAFEVIVEATTKSIGVVVDSVTGWRVHTAGTAVPVDKITLHPSSKEAVASIVEAREKALQPGGMLEVVDGLTGFQRAVIDFAADRYRYQGTREFAIWEKFDMSPVVYAMHFQNLLVNPHAEAYAPALIRFHRARTARQAAARSLKTGTGS